MQGLLESNSNKVCSKYFEQGLVDPDQQIKRDRDRDLFFSSRVWQIIFKQGLLKIPGNRLEK